MSLHDGPVSVDCRRRYVVAVDALAFVFPPSSGGALLETPRDWTIAIL
jgi:hypothetical protein